jgi:HSP20 family protein
MKKMCLLFLLVLTAASACAQTDIEEPDYEKIERLHGKLVRMKREMDRLMKDVISTYPQEGTALSADFGQEIRVDISEDEKSIFVRADLPGLNKDKIEVTLENNRLLKIAGTREYETKESSPGLIRQERGRGSFERALELPAEGVSEGIKAEYKDGVLSITIPKKEPAKRETTRVKVL